MLFPKPNHDNYNISIIYKYISNLYPNCQKKNIVCRLPNGSSKAIILPGNISVSLMVKLIMIILDISVNYFLIYDGIPLNLNDNKEIINFFKFSYATVYDSMGLLSSHIFEGKQLRVSMFFKNLGIFKFKYVFRYSPIRDLYYSDWEDKLKINKIYYNGKLLKEDDNNSLASLGINDDFGCIVE